MIENTKPKIRQLSLPVIEKIAAGEVIERPASVVKELVENSLDAGASKIEVSIEDAGFSSIKVFDNGFGMGVEDVKQCLLRHTTSKISSSDDLFSIGTMGFRGEALACISAVSRFALTSSDSTNGLGYSLKSEGGRLQTIEPVSHNRGTSIICNDLLYNVPARKKFMKSQKAERMAIIRLLEHLCISFPAIHFTLTAEGIKSLDTPQVDTPHMRIGQILGVNIAKRLIPCSGDENSMSMALFISHPQDAKARPRFQNLYVNLRRVDNDSVSYAVREAFSRFIMPKLKPLWFCFLDIEPSRMDINIHPTKKNIKFDNEKDIFSFIFSVTHSSLTKEMNVNHYTSQSTFDTVPLKRESIKKISSDAPLLNEQPPPYHTSLNQEKAPNKNDRYNRSINEQNPIFEEGQQTEMSFLSIFDEKASEQKNTTDHSNHAITLNRENWNLISCYQIHKKYILAPIKNGVILIDQHAAHERILFEEALEDIKRGRSESQRLLFPITFSMNQTEKEILLTSRDNFTILGFDIQDFGGNTIAVSAMPATGFLKSTQVEDALREMVQSLIDETDKEILASPQKQFAASFACGAAIKFGQELKHEEMNALFNSLFGTKNPYICPHGRPTFIRISLDELTRRFLR